MTHKHTFTRSPRKHRRPPRFFVRCPCGLERQAVISYGYIHVFTTGRTRVVEPMKNYSIRLPRRPDRRETKVIQRYLYRRPK